MLLTGFSGYASYLNATQLMDSTIEVEHVHTVLTSLTDVVATISDAESERRSYLLSRDKEELALYSTTIQVLDSKIHLLHLKVADNLPQYQRMVTLESLITQWKSHTDQAIRVYEQYPSTKQLPVNLRRQIQQTRTEIQHLITAMQTSEEKQIQQWVEQAQSNTALRLTIDLLSTLLSFIILASMFALHHRQMMRRQQVEIKFQQAEAYQRILVQEKELSELKLRFFSMVSHEFRTPLSLILGSAQLLMEDIQNWNLEKKRNNLERIQSAARIMNQLLTDTLTLTRAEAGKLEFAPTLIDVESFCLNLVEDLQVLNEPNHHIQFISLKHCPPACLDEKLLYSILNNLLYNAIKYSPQGSTIQFSLNCIPREIIFQVKDQGIGIPAEAQQDLYEPFHRASNVGMIEGTGLGLAVVKKCVELHRGQIFLESEVGIGTTVTVHLPLIFSR